MADTADRSGGFLTRNLETIVTAVVSLIAIGFGFLQFNLSEGRREHEITMESERADQEWKLALTRFATENYDQTFANDEAKRARLRALMNATFPSDLLKEFYEEQTKSATTFTEIAELSDAYAALGRATAGSGISAGRVTADASHDPSGGTSPSYRVVGDDLSAVRRREGPPDH